MSPLTCPDVEARLDLYAAGECEPAEAEAIRGHLTRCSNCAAACDEARQLVGLIELRLQEPERLRRLRARIAAEAAPRMVLRFPPVLRRVVSLAAVLLLAVRLVGWLAPGLAPVEGNSGLVAELQEEKGRGAPEMHFAPADFHPAVKKGPPESRTVPGNEQGAGFQPPPAIDLSLELRNTTDRPMRVWVAGPQTELRLDVRGPGAVSVPVKQGDEAVEHVVELPPGKSHAIHISRLTDGRRSWYWTKPGDYTVTAAFTTLAWSPGLSERRVTVRSAPLTIPFEKQ